VRFVFPDLEAGKAAALEMASVDSRRVWQVGPQPPVRQGLRRC